ncbi:hypothetical protein CBER1_08709 [Cercospora berteroae]|uniref:Uncharacterized protein n=1 Tax=Cercospora berteroae TaxID=357750 RepID=A0A2S6CAA2_9PEZI|nr:hypothetical protein CBER1_08709 [Cercospora berteroae]
MSGNNSNNPPSSNNADPESHPTPNHQVYDPLAPPSVPSHISPQSNGTSSTDDFAAEPFAGLEDPFASDEGGAGRWNGNGSSYNPPPTPTVAPPGEDENSEAMRAFVQEMIETRRERRDWDDRVEIERGQGVRARPGRAARERLRWRAERRRERMGVVDEEMGGRVVERVDGVMEVEEQEEEVVQEPKRKKIRLSEDLMVDGKERDR